MRGSIGNDVAPSGAVRKRLAHGFEAAVVRLGGAILRALPLDRASDLAGGLARRLGPRLGASRRAAANLKIAFPDLAAAEIDRVIGGMWDNLGRVAAEYAGLERLMAEHDRIEIAGGAVLDRLRAADRPALLFTAHLANWEAATLAARRHGLELAAVYRAFNNPLVDRLIRDWRRCTEVELITKGAGGARRLVKRLSQGGQGGQGELGRHVIMLVDQRMNDGIPVPFFGRPAMTAPALAELGYRYDAPLVPVRVERLAGSRFRVTVEAPLELPRTGDRPADVAAAMALVNRRIEAWIRARPEQWFWLHRRWGKSATGEPNDEGTCPHTPK